jgi:hypothetical protein
MVCRIMTTINKQGIDVGQCGLPKAFKLWLQGIVALSELEVPVYITETGVADARGDRRKVFLDTYLPEVRGCWEHYVQVHCIY